MKESEVERGWRRRKFCDIFQNFSLFSEISLSKIWLPKQHSMSIATPREVKTWIKLFLLKNDNASAGKHKNVTCE